MHLVNALPGVAAQGLIWGIMAIGVYITFRILDVADLTVDGTMATGGATFIMLTMAGAPMPLAMLGAFLAGVLAGLVTGLFHTACGIPAILAGILTQLALYSVNLRIMGQANRPVSSRQYDLLVDQQSVRSLSLDNPILVVAIFVAVVIAVLYWFFGTELGASLRATGSNPNMSRAQGINTNFTKVLGLMLSNGLVALSSALLAQYQGFADVNMGRGAIVIDGVDVTRLPEHKRAKFIGRVFQDPMMGTAPTMQIEENLALAARRGQRRGLGWGITKTERADYRELLRDLDLGLEDRLTSKVGLLSGGQRQALTLLMAALKRPKLLLLDEHTAALDPKTAAKVLELSDKIVAENGLTTMMVTHNMKDAIAHGNRLIMMYDGNIVIDVSGEEKKKLTVPDLLALFSKVSGSDEADDKLLLS